MQVEANSVATEYSPYGTTATYPIPASIQALEGYGRGVINAYNYIDFERKKFVQMLGSVDLGTLEWNLHAGTGLFFASLPSNAKVSTVHGAEAICPRYEVMYNTNYTTLQTLDKACTVCEKSFSTSYKYILVSDSSYSTGSEIKTALNGVTLYYELQTPVETDISEYLTDDNLIHVDSGGTLTFENQHGDDYLLPVPSEETYMIDLQASLGG
jgi:hypothetical protein